MAQDLADEFQVSRLPEDCGGRMMSERVRADLSRQACFLRQIMQDMRPMAPGQTAVLAVAEKEILRPDV